MTSGVLKFTAVVPRQGEGGQVASFVATAATLSQLARVERAGRDASQQLAGFQRPQIAGHIRNIRNYLVSREAILPNALIIGFTGGAKITRHKDGCTLSVDTRNGPPGFVVDGQQRFTALKELERPEFEVLVSAFICEDTTDLIRQFILINSVKPLPRSLVFELMRVVPELNGRVSMTQLSEKIIELLNYSEESILAFRINRHTCPEGKIKDSAIRKLAFNALSDGFLRTRADDAVSAIQHGFNIFNEFFHAVADVFPDAWHDKTPKTSRLVNRVGIVAMGFVLEHLYEANGARTRKEFAKGLKPLVGHTAWTSGYWKFGKEKVAWNSPQNISRDERNLALYLTRLLRRPASTKRRVRR